MAGVWVICCNVNCDFVVLLTCIQVVFVLFVGICGLPGLTGCTLSRYVCCILISCWTRYCIASIVVCAGLVVNIEYLCGYLCIIPSVVT